MIKSCISISVGYIIAVYYICIWFGKTSTTFVGHICSIILIGLAYFSFVQHSYQSAVELFIFATLYIYGSNLTFPIFQTLKMIISFFFFSFEVSYYSKKITLRYLLSKKYYPWHTCHSMISVGDKVYHYSFPVGNANTTDRSTSLTSNKGEYGWIERAMFAPCVGMAVILEEEKILQKLQACGKCHDWAVISLYLLSCNKFLTYAVLTPLRWTTWLTLGLGIICNVGYMAHLFITALDMVNLTEERLVSSSDAVRRYLIHRSSMWEYFKFSLLLLVCCVFCFSEFDIVWMGYFCFVFVSTMMCVLVDLILRS
eukprot:gene17473-24182_t